MPLKFVFFTVLFPTTFWKSEAATQSSSRVLFNLQQIYWRTTIPKYDFNKVFCNFIEITLWHGYSTVNLVHIFRTPFLKNTSEQLLLQKYKLYFVKLYLKDCNTRNKDSKMLTYAQVVSFHYVAFFDLRVGQRKVYFNLRKQKTKRFRKW